MESPRLTNIRVTSEPLCDRAHILQLGKGLANQLLFEMANAVDEEIVVPWLEATGARLNFTKIDTPVTEEFEG